MPGQNRIRKAVIPIAGLGTRLLPFTKSVPKEMLPISNKPLIQHAVEEAVQSGIEEIILVTSPGRTIAEQYFQRDVPLERMLESRGHGSEAKVVRDLSRLAAIRTVFQEQPRGLGDAIASARVAVGREPFGVILPDALMVAPRPCLGQLMAWYEKSPGCYVATREITIEECCRFGVLEFDRSSDLLPNNSPVRVTGIVEKPTPQAAPSRYGIYGRYLLEADIFDYFDRVTPDRNGEIQLSDALGLYSRDHPVYAVRFDGSHYDVGNRLGILQASVEMGLNDPEVGTAFREFLSSLKTD